MKFTADRIFLLALALIGAGIGRLAGDPTLEDQSPFLPPNFTPADKAKQDNQAKKEEVELKFEGVYNMGDIWYIFLYVTKEDKGHWIRVDDRSAPFYIKSFNREQNSIMVEIDQKLKEFTLEKTPEHKPMAVVTAPPPPPPPPPNRPGAGKNPPGGSVAGLPPPPNVRQRPGQPNLPGNAPNSGNAPIAGYPGSRSTSNQTSSTNQSSSILNKSNTNQTGQFSTSSTPVSSSGSSPNSPTGGFPVPPPPPSGPPPTPPPSSPPAVPPPSK